MLRFLRVDKRQLQLLDKIPIPMLVTSTKGRILWDNCRAGQPASRAAAAQLPAVALNMLASRSCDNQFGSEQISIDGHLWLLLSLPFLGPDSLFSDRLQRLLCLIDLEKGRVADAKATLQHIAHDVRAPLVSILTLIEQRGAALGDASASGAQRKDLEFLGELRRQAEYSLRISRDFLQLSRAEQISQASFSLFSLEDIVIEAIDYMWLNANQKSIQLAEPQCTLTDTRVRGNVATLIRAIVNILDNAIKYSPSGTTVQTHLLLHHDGRLLLRLVDQGEGIAPDDLPLVFDSMFQSARHRGQQQGVGLGLSFVKRVVEHHGGEVVIDSRPGQGTELRLLLPRA